MGTLSFVGLVTPVDIKNIYELGKILDTFYLVCIIDTT